MHVKTVYILWIDISDIIINCIALDILVVFLKFPLKKVITNIKELNKKMIKKLDINIEHVDTIPKNILSQMFALI